MTTKKKTGPTPAKALPVTSTEAALSEDNGAVHTRQEAPNPARCQIQSFDEGVQLFTKRRYSEAQARFEETLCGPAAHVTDKARSYIQVCVRKTSAADIHPQTAEEFFNYGVERLNARDMDQARLQFSRALAMQPDGDHIHYTLALACGFSGDGDGAYENLKRAIELEPRNRILARQDPEFSALANQFPPLRTLLQAESNGPF